VTSMADQQSTVPQQSNELRLREIEEYVGYWLPALAKTEEAAPVAAVVEELVGMVRDYRRKWRQAQIDLIHAKYRIEQLEEG